MVPMAPHPVLTAAPALRNPGKGGWRCSVIGPTAVVSQETSSIQTGSLCNNELGLAVDVSPTPPHSYPKCSHLRDVAPCCLIDFSVKKTSKMWFDPQIVGPFRLCLYTRQSY